MVTWNGFYLYLAIVRVYSIYRLRPKRLQERDISLSVIQVGCAALQPESRRGLTLSHPRRHRVMISLGPNLHLQLHSIRRAAASPSNRCIHRLTSTLPRSESNFAPRNHGKHQRNNPSQLTSHHGRLWQTLMAGTMAFQPTGDTPSLWLALGAFVGLPLALWVYKVCLHVVCPCHRPMELCQCIMMVVFQRKIIYMGT